MGNGNFKVGDRVKRISNPYDDVKVGATGIVTKINENYDTVRVKIDHMSKEGTWAYDYIEKVSNQPTTIIHHNDRETIATLKDGKTILKTAKAICNPSDTFNAHFGRALALARLNEDQKMIDWLLIGEEKPFVPNQSRIVKQDKYEVGDKVKVRGDLKAGNLTDGLYVTPDMPELKGKVVTIEGLLSTPDRYDICESSWSWSGDCFEGKVIEEPVTTGQPVTAPIIIPFDWEGFKSGKFAVHCDTEEKAMQFFDELKIQGIKWRSDKELNSHETHWDCYRDKTTFGFMRGGMGYGDLEDFTVNIPYTPNYREVDRPAKVGEWIKIVAPDTLVHTGYSEGDLIHVDELAGENENGIVIKPFHIVQREYVVLEPINHSIELIAHAEQQYIEVKRQAKTGERVKIVKAEQIPTTDGKPDYKNGDVLEISNGGYQARYAAGTGDNGCARVLLPNEYVVLESVPVPAQPKEVIDLTSISDEELITELSRRLNK